MAWHASLLPVTLSMCRWSPQGCPFPPRFQPPLPRARQERRNTCVRLQGEVGLAISYQS